MPNEDAKNISRAASLLMLAGGATGLLAALYGNREFLIVGIVFFFGSSMYYITAKIFE